MKLEDQVCSLELARKLKELGVKQESSFYHIIENGHYKLYPYKAPGFSLEGIRKNPRKDWDWCSAFTVAELLAMIPKVLENKENRAADYYFRIFTDDCIEWCVAHEGVDGSIYSENSDDPNLANVLARMLAYLIKIGRVNPEKGCDA